jgi:hypothetical protein
MPKKVGKVQKSAEKAGGAWKIIIPAVLAILIIVVIIIGVANKPKSQPNVTVKVNYEITEKDIFAKELRSNFTGNTVSVLGLKLGDELEKASFVLGEPDLRKEYPNESIVNLEYGQKLGLNSTGVIYNFRNGMLNRITVYKAFNPYLKGYTQINHSLREVYDIFGIRDREYNLPTKPTLIRVFVYEKKGLEVFIDGSEVGFSFIQPK